MNSLHLTVKFILLAVFTVTINFIYIFYEPITEKEKFSFLIYGITYSLFVYIFGGVDKFKISSFTNVFVIYAIVNFFSLIIFFAYLGIFSLSIQKEILFNALILSIIVFPLLVFFLYNFLNKNLPAIRCLILGSNFEWKKVEAELKENSFFSFEILDFVQNQENNSDFLKQKVLENKPVNLIICTSHIHFNHTAISGVRVPFIRLNVLVEKYCKKIPIEIVKSFDEYYNVIFSNITMSRLSRIIDTVVCFILLLFSLPLLILAAFFILIFDGKPIFFKQERHGYMGKKFHILKLRTWDIDSQGNLISTKTGFFLRKIRLNEIPQFYNVIKGEMSLVGPRPDVPSTFKFCIENIPFYEYRNFVKPGITGHAQVSYKYVDKLEVETFSRRLSYDLYYVKNNSFFLYLTTILKTIESIFFLRGN